MTTPLTIAAVAALAVASELSRRGSTNKSINLHFMEWWAKHREQLGTMSGDRSRGLYEGAEAIAAGADPATVPDAPVIPFSAYFENFMQDNVGWRRNIPSEKVPRLINLCGRDPRFPYAHRSEQIDPRPPPLYGTFIDAISGDVSFWVHRGHGPSKLAAGEAWKQLDPVVQWLAGQEAKQAFSDLYDSDSTTMWRRLKGTQGRWNKGLLSLHDKNMSYGMKPGTVVPYQVHWSDVLIHWGMTNSPLSSKGYGHEREVILKPGMSPREL
jgi:hypothetical protein